MMKKVIMATILSALYAVPVVAQWSSTFDEGKRFDEVSWLINHNANNNRVDGPGIFCFGGSDQDRGMQRQLEDGVRSFMVDIYRVHDKYRLKHGPTNTCMMDGEDFNHILYNWISRHPNDIVTLHIQSGPNLGLSGLEDIFKGRRSGYKNLGSYIYQHNNFISDGRPVGSGSDVYPTIREMLDQKKQLVIFTETNYGSDLFRYEFAHTVQNPYRASQANQLFNSDKFTVHRGIKHKTIMTINHFAGDAPTYNGDRNKSRDANATVLAKARTAWWMFGHRPSVAVDFHNLSNDRLPMRQIEEVNTWNEVRGSIKINGRGLDDIRIETGIWENGRWRDRKKVSHQGREARWHRFYSAPAAAGEKRSIIVSHPDYNFSPNVISLNNYAGNSGKTFVVDITATRK